MKLLWRLSPIILKHNYNHSLMTVTSHTEMNYTECNLFIHAFDITRLSLLLTGHKTPSYLLTSVISCGLISLQLTGFYLHLLTDNVPLVINTIF